MQGIDIRHASIEDAESAAALLMRQLEEHRIDIPYDAVRLAVNGMLADPNRGFILIASSDKGPVGVAYVSFTWTLEHGGKSSWLEELYVVPDQRSLGIGCAMLDEVLRKAADAGCVAVDLEVEAEHSRAENLYARAGFKPHTRRRWVRAF